MSQIQSSLEAPPNLIASNVNVFEGDLLLTCSYSPEISPESFRRLAEGRRAFSFCPELTHLDKLGFKLCTIFRLGRVTSLWVLTKDGSPHSMQIPLMVQEAAEDVGMDKANIRYFCLEQGELYEIHDLTVRKARHYSEIEKLLPFSRLAAVTTILRGEDGCPNDRAETFESVADHFREEAEEVAQAVSSGDVENLQEELGDLLYNIYLISEIAREKGLFDVRAVTRRAADKMVDMHPQVFDGRSYKW